MYHSTGGASCSRLFDPPHLWALILDPPSDMPTAVIGPNRQSVEFRKEHVDCGRASNPGAL